MCLSGRKKFFGKFGVFCSFVASVLRFVFSPYYRRNSRQESANASFLYVPRISKNLVLCITYDISIFQPEAKCEILLCYQKMLFGLGNSASSGYRDIYKACKACLIDKSMAVRCAASKVCRDWVLLQNKLRKIECNVCLIEHDYGYSQGKRLCPNFTANISPLSANPTKWSNTLNSLTTAKLSEFKWVD